MSLFFFVISWCHFNTSMFRVLAAQAEPWVCRLLLKSSMVQIVFALWLFFLFPMTSRTWMSFVMADFQSFFAISFLVYSLLSSCHILFLCYLYRYWVHVPSVLFTIILDICDFSRRDFAVLFIALYF